MAASCCSVQHHLKDGGCCRWSKGSMAYQVVWTYIAPVATYIVHEASKAAATIRLSGYQVMLVWTQQRLVSRADDVPNQLVSGGCQPLGQVVVQSMCFFVPCTNLYKREGSLYLLPPFPPQSPDLFLVHIAMTTGPSPTHYGPHGN
jgi:hypothetical protein